MITSDDVKRISHSVWDRSRTILARTRDLGKFSLATAVTQGATYGRWLGSITLSLWRARKLWLLLVEVTGVVLVTWGISFWSVPSAIIVGGLTLVAIMEVTPNPGPRFPNVPVPETALRIQAERAAEVINNERYGLAMVDPVAFEKLSIQDCERLIILARNLGVKRT